MAILGLHGIPHFHHMSKAYLWGCGALFVAYEILFLVSIALSQNHDQVLIIAMINYLWPPLTIVFSILAKQLNYRWPVILGFIVSVIGLLLVVNPDLLNLHQFLQILQQNPMAYFFAFLGALLWPCYSVLTKKYAQGQNAVPLFFVVTAIALWGIHFMMDEAFIFPQLNMWLLITVTGGLVGIAYSNWNQSLQFGNIKLLILATYFMPVLSSFMSMLILDATPNFTFWIGTCLVTFGAMICWKNTAEIQV